MQSPSSTSFFIRTLIFMMMLAVVWPVICVALQTEQKPRTVQADQKLRQVTRAQRPSFSKSDWDGIYFEDLFKEGLVGERPTALLPGQLAQTPRASESIPSATDTPSQTSAWNALISRTTIEDEIKSIQKQLAADIKTPVLFKSEYLKSHQSFSLLSMLFAVISQYDGEVRWKDDAARAQVAFWRAAANSRVGTVQAFESCKSRAELLAEMIRGGKFVGDELAPDDVDWSNIVDRNPLMHRLQTSLDKLKTVTASQGDFARQSSEVMHESELVAAIALALSQENMTDADDDGYRQFSMNMQKAAQLTTEGVKSNNYDAVSKAVNTIGQSCDACHAEWR